MLFIFCVNIDEMLKYFSFSVLTPIKFTSLELVITVWVKQDKKMGITYENCHIFPCFWAKSTDILINTVVPVECVDFYQKWWQWNVFFFLNFNVRKLYYKVLYLFLFHCSFSYISVFTYFFSKFLLMLVVMKLTCT